MKGEEATHVSEKVKAAAKVSPLEKRKILIPKKPSSRIAITGGRLGLPIPTQPVRAKQDVVTQQMAANRSAAEDESISYLEHFMREMHITEKSIQEIKVNGTPSSRK